jgi:TetR/AcrR family transcriptional repressor of mexJK operon
MNGSGVSGEDSRSKIVNSAREIFFREGFVAANLDRVARRAGLAKGTLYRYFESKAELYVAVLVQNGDEFERLLRASISPDQPAVDQIRQAARFYFEHWTENRNYFSIFWAIENQSVIGELPPSVVAEVTKLWKQCLQILADVIDQGIRDGQLFHRDPWEAANIFWTLGNAIIQTDASPVRRALRRKPLDEAFDDAVEVLLRGLTTVDTES